MGTPPMKDVEADTAAIRPPPPPWKKWLLIPAQVLLAIGVYLAIDDYLDRRAAEPEQLAKTAKRMNGSVPRMVDDDTRLDRIEVKDQTLTYRYTILKALDEKPHPKRLWRQHAFELCQSEEERVLHEHGVTFRFVYESRDLEPLADVTVKPEPCP